MGKDLIVFMPQFAAVDRLVWEHNFQSFLKHNPGVDIVPFPEKDVKDPFCKKMLEQHLTGWANCDLVVLDFYRQNPGYERYLYVEWDSYCTMNVHRLIDPVRKFDVVAREVADPTTHSNWEWFRHSMPLLPAELKPLMCCTRPLCGMSFSARALEKLAKPNPLTQINMFSEVRVGTLAKFYGFEPAVYPVFGTTLFSDHPLTFSAIRGEGIWHKVKARCFPFEAPKPDCLLIGHWAGLGVRNGTEFELCGDGHIRFKSKVVGQWLYREDDSELILAWADRDMEWFEVTNDMCRNGMKRIYKTRYQ